ncbi:MAG: sensory rhodopsin transducer [Candidatus Humimicrobiaceae bacterium]
MKEYGSKLWFIPDAERPPAGQSELKGHESIILLNPNDQNAIAYITLYFSDQEPVRDITVSVDAERVRCLRTDDLIDMQGFEVPLCTQYSIKVESNVPIVAQYGRLDARQTNLAYYTVLGYTV